MYKRPLVLIGSLLRALEGRRGLVNERQEAMMFKRIDHVEIVTDQLEQTERFYTEVLGFTVKARDRIERSGLGVPIDLVYLDLGGTVVELISYEGAPEGQGSHPDPVQDHGHCCRRCSNESIRVHYRHGNWTSPSFCDGRRSCRTIRQPAQDANCKL